MYGKLVVGLAGLGVALDKTEGFDVGGNDPGVSNPLSIPQGLSLASIFIVFILLVVVLFLGVAYRIRVSRCDFLFNLLEFTLNKINHLKFKAWKGAFLSQAFQKLVQI